MNQAISAIARLVLGRLLTSFERSKPTVLVIASVGNVFYRYHPSSDAPAVSDPPLLNRLAPRGALYQPCRRTVAHRQTVATYSDAQASRVTRL